MKKIISIIGLVSSLFIFQSVQADPLRLYMVSASGKATILYRDPTKHSEVIASIPINSKWLIERSRPKVYGNRTWRKISWKSRRGWVLSTYVKYDPATSLLANRKTCRAKKENAKGCKASSSTSSK